MRFHISLGVLVAVCAMTSVAQFGGFRGFFRGFQGGATRFVRPVQQMFHHHMVRPISHFMPRMPKFFGGGQSEASGGSSGTEKPQSTGIDKLYPEDCGRDKNNKGLLCFPDGKLCSQSNILISITRGLLRYAQRFDGKKY
jgi:hypothetical protein